MHWYSQVGDEVDEDMGLWVVEQDFNGVGAPLAGIIHLDSIL